MRSIKGERRISLLSPLAVIFFSCALLGVALKIGYSVSPSFADLVNGTLAAACRYALAKVTSLFPFSLAEMLLFLSPLLIIALTCFILKAKSRGKRHLIRAVFSLAGAFLFVFFLFTVTLSPGYHGTRLSEKLSLTEEKADAETLYRTTMTVIGELNALCDEIDYSSDGSSSMPFSSAGDLSHHLCTCYSSLSEKYPVIPDFSSKVKPLVISPLMTYTHISGVYSFFTGEANLNTNYPDFVNVYTAAHEMAHQRGISREDEANFAAFLACISSEDSYVRYSGYLNMYEYLSSDLYSADYSLFEKAYGELSADAKNELLAYSVFFDKYRDNTAADISDSLNDAYLVNQGTEGTRSYGLVVDLAISYYSEANQDFSE